MSIQGEITRINTAKINISAAITRKGVTVPSGVKVEDYPALIDSIQGETPTYNRYTVGSATPTSSIGENGDLFLVV